MAHVGGHELVAVVHVRLGVVSKRRGLGEAGQYVERRPPPRAVASTARRLGRDAGAQRLDQLELAFDAALVGAEHLLFVRLQRRRDEALAAGNRLLADVVVGRRMQVRLRDLDVVPEHAVEPHFERLDAGARAFRCLQLGDDLLARSADAPQVVELGIDAVAHGAAVTGQRGRVVGERGVDRLAASQRDRRARPPGWR